MLLLRFALALTALAGQDPAATRELPSSRYALLPRHPIEEEDVLEVDADGAFRVDGRRFVAAGAGEADLRASLEAWLASVARGMPAVKSDRRAPRSAEPGAATDVVREGALRVRAHPDAPWSRVRAILSGCADRRVGILRVQLAARDPRAPEEEGWLELRLPELTGTEVLPEGSVIGLDRRDAETHFIGSFRRVDVELRALEPGDDGERRLEYRLGPRRYGSLRATKVPAGALYAEEPTRPFALAAAGDVRWGEVLALLDLLRDVGVEEPLFVRPGARAR